MIEALTSNLAVNRATNCLLYYRNRTSQLQIIRVDQLDSQQFEKIIFPNEQVLFYASPEAFLNIYTNSSSGLVEVNRLPCFELQVLEVEPFVS